MLETIFKNMINSPDVYSLIKPALKYPDGRIEYIYMNSETLEIITLIMEKGKPVSIQIEKS